MHKGIILLVKNEDGDTKADILDKVSDFLEPYGEGNVWDFYNIGGRWTCTLAPKHDDFSKWACPFLLEKENNENKESTFISQSVIETFQDVLQAKWEEMGMKGKNPFCNHYELSPEGGFYDIMPLKDCIDTVKHWSFDYIEAGKKQLQEANNYLEANKDYGMYGYLLSKAGDLFQQHLCWGCQVFNTDEEYYDYSLPTDLDGWTAVIVDIHN